MKPESFYMSQAIKNLKPNAEFVFQNDDYATISWVKCSGAKPTESEILAEMQKIKDNELAEIANTAALKLAVLDRLQITEEEAKALLS